MAFYICHEFFYRAVHHFTASGLTIQFAQRGGKIGLPADRLFYGCPKLGRVCGCQADHGYALVTVLLGGPYTNGGVRVEI